MTGERKRPAEERGSDAHLLRDEWESATNALHAACRDAAEGHARAAVRAENPELAALLRALAAEREAFAATLNRELRQEGELPEARDPDAASLRRLLEWARASLAADADRSIFEDRRQVESELRERLAEALATDLPEPLRRRLTQWRDTLAGADARLAGAEARDHERS